jgi:hypothetical protein
MVDAAIITGYLQALSSQATAFHECLSRNSQPNPDLCNLHLSIQFLGHAVVATAAGGGVALGKEIPFSNLPLVALMRLVCLAGSGLGYYAVPAAFQTLKILCVRWKLDLDACFVEAERVVLDTVNVASQALVTEQRILNSGELERVQEACAVMTLLRRDVQIVDAGRRHRYIATYNFGRQQLADLLDLVLEHQHVPPAYLSIPVPRPL